MISFGLKNVRFTYYRLMNKMFTKLFVNTIEVYVDDMLIKSLKIKDHDKHLDMTSKILRRYSMILKL